MSGVRLKDRTKSKSQFDNTYYKLFDDVTDMVNNGFYASAELKEQYASFIMDDIFIIADSKEYLKQLLFDIIYQLADLELYVNFKKTHITKLTHGFTFMQIKYHVSNGKVIKRPTRSKITRARRRLKKFKKKYNQGIMTELEIRNCYLSWRNTVVKDCNACKRTIANLDNLYDKLFPEREVYVKPTRSQLVQDAFKNEFSKEYAILNY